MTLLFQGRGQTSEYSYALVEFVLHLDLSFKR